MPMLRARRTLRGSQRQLCMQTMQALAALTDREPNRWKCQAGRRFGRDGVALVAVDLAERISLHSSVLSSHRRRLTSSQIFLTG